MKCDCGRIVKLARTGNYAIIGYDNLLKINKQLIYPFKSISYGIEYFVRILLLIKQTTVQLRFNILV